MFLLLLACCCFVFESSLLLPHTSECIKEAIKEENGS